MNTEYETDNSQGLAERLELLEMARNLDRLGHRLQRYISTQLQDLEAAIADFEREKNAWRRQRDREIERLLQSRSGESIEDSDQDGSVKHHLTISEVEDRERRTAMFGRKKKLLPKTAGMPLNLLIDCGKATPMQVGLLLFEISKSNRDFGGDGVRYNIDGIRLSKITKDSESAGQSVLLKLEGFSRAPLFSYDGEATDQLERWTEFKTQLTLSEVEDRTLVRDFKKATTPGRNHSAHMFASEVTGRAETASRRATYRAQDLSPFVFETVRRAPAAADQIQRVEQVLSYLHRECRVRLHVSLVAE